MGGLAGMGCRPWLLGLLPLQSFTTPLSASASSVAFDLVGQGDCEDASGQAYEQWFLLGEKVQSLTYVGDDPSSCSCPECQQVCELFLACLGFQYNCCPESSADCGSSGAILFSHGTRPSESPPGNFSLVGVSGAATKGGNLTGNGAISGVELGPNHTFCYKKAVEPGSLPPSGKTTVGYLYKPHTMDGTARTFVPRWEDCQLLCRSTPLCETFGFWPDGGCHLQAANTTLFKGKCLDGQGEVCPSLAVISGPRDFSEKWWPVLPTGDDGVPAADFHRHSASTNASAVPEQVSLFQDPRQEGLRGALVLVLMLVVAALALYLAAQADWSKRRTKKRRIKQARMKKEREAGFTSSSSSSEDFEDEDSESNEEGKPLSRKRSP
mmetsp:Transcript_82700/g.267768  ORF Transcript_82700/g.267768 Transcript_82700/m.267768 type:complete len:381 (-) Transcript_82700:309-1451(-)